MVDAKGSSPLFTVLGLIPLLLAALGAVPQQGWAQVGLSLPDTAAAYGDTVRVPIRVGDPAGQGIVAIEMGVAYAAQVISVLDTLAQAGTLSQSGWSIARKRVAGANGVDTLKIAMSTAQDTLDRAGELIALLVAVGQARQPNSTALRLTRALFNEGSPLALPRDGSLRLLGADGTLQATYVIQAADGPAGRDTLRVQVADADLDVDGARIDTGQAVVHHAVSAEVETLLVVETAVHSGVFQGRLPTVLGSTGADRDGALTVAAQDTLLVSYEDRQTEQGGGARRMDTTYVVGLLGEVTGNGTVGALDAAQLLGMSVGLRAPSPWEVRAGDVDGSGEILAFDASLVLQYAVGLIARFPVQTSLFNHPFLKPVPTPPAVFLGELQAQPDGTCLLPVCLQEREGIVAGMVQVGYDPGVEVVEVTAGEGYGEYLLAHRVTAAGVRLAFAGARSPAQGAGEVLQVRVRLPQDRPRRFRVEEGMLNDQRLRPGAVEPEGWPAAAVPRGYALYPNHPNPFNPGTAIRYELPEAVEVSLEVYNLAGQRVRVLAAGIQQAGVYRLGWDGRDERGAALGSGVYLLRLHAGPFLQTRKMLLVQ